MGDAVHWAVLTGLKGREGFLVGPGGGVRLDLGRGLDEAAVEGVLWIMVSYYTVEPREKKQGKKESKQTQGQGVS